MIIAEVLAMETFGKLRCQRCRTLNEYRSEFYLYGDQMARGARRGEKIAVEYRRKYNSNIAFGRRLKAFERRGL